MIHRIAKSGTLGLALGLAWGCNTKKAPEAPPPAAESSKDESAADSTVADDRELDANLYEEDPYGDAASSDSSSSDTATSTGSTTDIMGAFAEAQAAGPQAPDEKAMFGRAALTGLMSVMPTLLQAGMSGQKVDLGRIGMAAAYNTGQNMMQQYGANAQQTALQQQQLQQQQLQQQQLQQQQQQQQQLQQLQSQGQTYGEESVYE